MTIVDLISRFTNLKPVGDVFVGKDPMHSGCGESLVVYPDKQMFRCFACGRSGYAEDFLTGGKLTRDQSSALLESIGFEVEDKKPEPVPKDVLLSMYQDSMEFYCKTLHSETGKPGLEYLHQRGLTEKTIQTFSLGYSPASGNSLFKYLLFKGYPKEQICASGLAKEYDGVVYDMFRGRVMFPILRTDGKCVAFGGRAIGDRKPKYLNSPESTIFHKGETLYGVSDFPSAEKIRCIVLVEGYMDVISLHQAGVRNSAATLGTAFTRNHIPALRKYTNNLILSMDSDEPGQKSIARALNVVLSGNLKARVLDMSPYKDPDELISKEGRAEYLERAKRAISGVDFLLRYKAKGVDMDSVSARREFISQAVEILCKHQGK